MPQKNAMLAVFFGKRTVALLRTGEKGETSKNSKKFTGDNRKTKSNEVMPVILHDNQVDPRGWTAVQKTNIQMVNIVVPNRNIDFSNSTRRSLGIGKIVTWEEAQIAWLHDLAYEIARANNQHLLGWSVQSIQKGETLNCRGEWQDDMFIFKFENE